MKTIGLDKACYFRAHTPRWAHEPLSGEGAAIGGGRFNPVGYPALYLASDEATALAESRRSQLIVPPKTTCSYTVSLASVVDFSRGYTGNSQPDEWAMWDCNWRQLWHDERVRPPSWDLADALITKGASGLLFPSLSNPGGTNLVIFLGNLAAPDTIAVNDPDDDLPRNQLSWT